MAIWQFFKSKARVRSKPEQAPDIQVDYSYTQWRHAQMSQLVSNYHAACDSTERSPA
ncbi:hypothetical protein ACLBKU_02020 [Erythrobacter sp. NE805]|uniref:hypothetical protein n=1 Tax=Erythrobacter sp. NE805 TaxID=3389875 RepID=UPI00396B3A27